MSESFPLRRFDRCPLCGASAWTRAPAATPNLYSERLARLLGTSEASLLAACENRECGECGLVYKACWPQGDVLDRLFASEVPAHPKGWDARAGRFGISRFASMLAQLEEGLARADDDGVARARRTLDSMVDSLVEWEGTPQARDLRRAIAGHDVAAIRAALPALAGLAWHPWPFKRFSGFGAPGLWHWYDSVLGVIDRYAEVGCPLWGFLSRRPSSRVRLAYWRHDWPNYWGEGCREDGCHCRDVVATDGEVAVRAWDDPADGRIDLLGAYQFLDHLEDPLGFVASALKRARALALVLDAMDRPVAVQHFSGWSRRAIESLAARVGASAHGDFAPIRASGNEAWLLVAAA